jgi:ribonuclease P protein component
LQAVARAGTRLRTLSLDIRVVITSRDHSRIGFVVPKHGRTAVQRNRLKRALRELTRLTLLGALRDSAAGSSMDIVMRALPVAYDASFGPLRGEFDTLAGRLLDRVRQLSGGDATAPAEGQ